MDMRGARTKALLRESLLRLLNDKPFEKITVKEVCERAQTSKKAFYNHYPDLVELLIDCYLEAVPFTSDPYVAVGNCSNVEEVYLLLLESTALLLDFFKSHPNLAKAVVMNVGISPYFKTGFTANVEVLVNYMLRRFGTDKVEPVDSQRLALYAVSGWNGIIRQWVMEGMVESAEDLAKSLIAMNLHTCAFMVGRSMAPEHLELINRWRRGRA